MQVQVAESLLTAPRMETVAITFRATDTLPSVRACQHRASFLNTPRERASIACICENQSININTYILMSKKLGRTLLPWSAPVLLAALPSTLPRLRTRECVVLAHALSSQKLCQSLHKRQKILVWRPKFEDGLSCHLDKTSSCKAIIAFPNCTGDRFPRRAQISKMYL